MIERMRLIKLVQRDYPYLLLDELTEEEALDRGHQLLQQLPELGFDMTEPHLEEIIHCGYLPTVGPGWIIREHMPEDAIAAGLYGFNLWLRRHAEEQGYHAYDLLNELADGGDNTYNYGDLLTQAVNTWVYKSTFEFNGESFHNVYLLRAHLGGDVRVNYGPPLPVAMSMWHDDTPFSLLMRSLHVELPDCTGIAVCYPGGKIALVDKSGTIGDYRWDTLENINPAQCKVWYDAY